MHFLKDRKDIAAKKPRKAPHRDVAKNNSKFTEFDTHVDNEVTPVTECSKYACVENPRWGTVAVAILNLLNRYSSAADSPISLKLCTVTYIRSSKAGVYKNWNQKAAFFQISFSDHISATDQDIFKFVAVQWGYAACLMVQIRFLQKS